MKQIITDLKRKKLAEATHTTGQMPKVKYIAVGSGGVDQNGEVISPSKESTSLNMSFSEKSTQHLGKYLIVAMNIHY